MDHGDSAIACRDKLGIGVIHGGRNHQDSRVADVRGIVAFVEPKPILLKPLGNLAGPQVRPGDGIVQIQEDFGETAHTDPADPDEVDFSFPAVQRLLLPNILWCSAL